MLLNFVIVIVMCTLCPYPCLQTSIFHLKENTELMRAAQYMIPSLIFFSLLQPRRITRWRRKRTGLETISPEEENSFRFKIHGLSSKISTHIFTIKIERYRFLKKRQKGWNYIKTCHCILRGKALWYFARKTCQGRNSQISFPD